jgi:hypothetical protein
MQVETYECQETIAEPLEIAEEAIEIINNLELDGQKTLITKVHDTETDTRCPYRKMRADERFVYRLLCPTTTDAKKYSSSSMPLRVLQIMSHALSLDLFKKIVVWSADGEIKDPVLVAYDTEDTWRASATPFILARWAEELDEWSVLVKKAKQIWKEKAIAAIAKIKSQVALNEAFLENDAIGLDEIVQKDTPSYYGWS